MKTRIYVVKEKDSETVRLVEAASQGQAIRHVTTGLYEATVATPKDVAKAVGSGVTVEIASSEATV